MIKLLSYSTIVFNVAMTIISITNIFVENNVLSYIITIALPIQIVLAVYFLIITIKNYVKTKRQHKLINFINEYKIKKGDTVYINPNVLKETNITISSNINGVEIVYDKSIPSFKVETLSERRKKRINNLV